MQTQIQDPAPRIAAACEDIAMQLARQGWCVYTDFLKPAAIDALRTTTLHYWRDGQFRPAGVGRGEEFEVIPRVRNDRVMWLEPDSGDTAIAAWFSTMQALRLELNRRLYLGLQDYEAHMAVYPPGSFYQKHLDQFRGIGTRILTTSFYLNHDWRPEHGGQLRLYTETHNPAQFVDILPTAGTLVCFLSAEFLHEVLPARRERMSITGWFRHREP